MSPTCTRKFMSEELVYHITDPKGRDLNSELNTIMYERYEKTPPEIRKPIPKPPKKKRKVAPPPKMVNPENGPYLTYGDLFKKFESMTNWTDINDFRPYPLLDHSIIVWTNDGTERAYQYDPENFRFVLIENAKTYEEILENAWGGRKKV